jgi:hypothetical protein
MLSCELLRGFATSEKVSTSAKKAPELVLNLPCQQHDSNPVAGGQGILIEVRQANCESNAATDGEDHADPDQASAAIISPEEETSIGTRNAGSRNSIGRWSAEARAIPMNQPVPR